VKPLLLLSLLIACAGDSSEDEDEDDGGTSGGTADSCGDIDGSGGDTGDVPNVLGSWTATFGTYLYADNGCDVEGLEADDMSWLTGALDIDGRVPEPLIASTDPDTEFMGMVNNQGGIVFTGAVEEDGHMLYVSFGGLLYDVPQVERQEIRGFAYMGVDLDGADTEIDCWIQGDFIAKKSGN